MIVHVETSVQWLCSLHSCCQPARQGTCKAIILTGMLLLDREAPTGSTDGCGTTVAMLEVGVLSLMQFHFIMECIACSLSCCLPATSNATHSYVQAT